MVDLQSSVKSKGRWVTKIIHFKGGVEKTIEGVDTSTIQQGQFTKFFLRNGSFILVNDVNVLMIEVFTQED